MKKILMSVVLAGVVLFGACAEYFGDVVPLEKASTYINQKDGVEGGIVSYYKIGDWTVAWNKPHKEYTLEGDTKFLSFFKNVVSTDEKKVGKNNLKTYLGECLANQLPEGYGTFIIEYNITNENGKYFQLLGVKTSDGTVKYFTWFNNKMEIK